MKKVIIPILGSLLLASMVSCKKDQPVVATANATLNASKTDAIKKGELVTFSFSPVDSGKAVNWTVTPSANAQINGNGSVVSIVFSAKGSYTVTAVSGSLTASKSVSVTDSVSTGTGGGGNPVSKDSTVSFLSGEQIKITASVLDSTAKSVLAFSAQTSNSYPGSNNSLASNQVATANSLAINYTGVFIPGGVAAATGSAKAGGVISPITVASGSNTLTITANGTTYTGTIVKSGNSLTINWPYSSGVTISPTSF